MFLRIATGMTLALLVFATLPACSFLFREQPDDVKVTAVALIAYDSIPRHSTSQPQRQMLQVSLASMRDLGAITFDHELGTGVEATICPISSGHEIGISSLYYGSVVVSSWGTPREEYEAAIADHARGTPYVYQVYLDLRSIGQRFVMGKPVPAYDLQKEPADVCLRIEGSPYMAVGISLETNVVVVPKAMIAKALQDGLRP